MESSTERDAHSLSVVIELLYEIATKLTFSAKSKNDIVKNGSEETRNGHPRRSL